MRALLLVAVAGLLAPTTPSRLVSAGGGTSRIVALTFDAGADRGYAARILTTLEYSHIRASFGMTGKWATDNPDLVRRMSRDGDTFINHTYDHRSFTGLSAGPAVQTRAGRTWEISRTESIVHRLTGKSTKPYFRPPYGDYDTATLILAGQLGYRYTIMWTVDSLGWAHLSASSILARCAARLVPGAIYLMHVGIQSQDALALPAFLALLKRRGFRAVTIPQLLAHH